MKRFIANTLVLNLLTGFLSAQILYSPSSFASTDYYAGKTIKIGVGYSPGGGTDMLARIAAIFFTKPHCSFRR